MYHDAISLWMSSGMMMLGCDEKDHDTWILWILGTAALYKFDSGREKISNTIKHPKKWIPEGEPIQIGR